MGCDIHTAVEKYDEDSDTWFMIPVEIYQDIERRNYEFFAALAGVRGKGPEAKGLPDDISLGSQWIVHGWGTDGHSHTWEMLDDFLEIYKQHAWEPEYIADLKM